MQTEQSVLKAGLEVRLGVLFHRSQHMSEKPCKCEACVTVFCETGTKEAHAHPHW